MLDITGYTLGSNQPLNHARILWNMVEGTVTADGTNGNLAANDYTAQRWEAAAGANDWELTLPSAADIDTAFIAAHNLSGTTITISTSPDLVTAYTLRATVVVTDNSTIAAMFTDGSGNPISSQRIKVNVAEGTGKVVGIIRFGEALQMQRPFYGGFAPTRLNRTTEAQQTFSETAQWLGRTEKRIALAGSYTWMHLRLDWYEANFEPFAKSIPLNPFGIIGNPTKITNDVVWGWTNTDVSPSLMGILNYVQVELSLTGYWE